MLPRFLGGDFLSTLNWPKWGYHPGWIPPISKCRNSLISHPSTLVQHHLWCFLWCFFEPLQGAPVGLRGSSNQHALFGGRFHDPCGIIIGMFLQKPLCIYYLHFISCALFAAFVKTLWLMTKKFHWHSTRQNMTVYVCKSRLWAENLVTIARVTKPKTTCGAVWKKRRVTMYLVPTCLLADVLCENQQCAVQRY